MKKLRFQRTTRQRHWVGDGFPVRSIFSYNDIAAELSPFLLLDYAGPAQFEPTTQRRGVGQHPHRGFETVTIVYDGAVDHRDSAGGGGSIGPGDVQWMTAGAGLIHEEYHGVEFARRGGRFEMIQLWVNLPAKYKLTRPTYQSIASAQIPSIALPGDAGQLRVIAGTFAGHAGPAHTFSPLNLWDLRVQAGHTVELEVPADHTTALFVLRGAIDGDGQRIGEAELAAFEPAGDRLAFRAETDATLLFLGGEPLQEPIVGYGPFVMNTPEEIRQAVADFNRGAMGQMVETV